MRGRGVICAGLAAASLAVGACAGQPSPPKPPIAPAGTPHAFDLQRVADGLVRPTWVQAAPGDREGLWVLEQAGRVLRLEDGRRTTVLDLGGEVKVGAEQGLLGAAFHPDFARNHRLFLHYSDPRGDTRVIEVRVSAGGRAALARRRVLLAVRQPEENHNGGALAFGPDGKLYLGLGDGGGAFDPGENAQDLRSKLGKLLVADVDGSGRPRWEVALYGLRNPWRFWLDSALNEVWIGDVGQDESEEVHRVALEPDEPPKNLGWPAFEGLTPHRDRRLAGRGQLQRPVVAYPRAEGCSIIGGLIYRGRALPQLRGRYVYGDFCSGSLWSLYPTPEGRARDIRRERATLPLLTHIGVDAEGELVLTSASGEVSRAVPPGRPAGPPPDR
jgi:glucose/arabinose dehydrogenase